MHRRHAASTAATSEEAPRTMRDGSGHPDHVQQADPPAPTILVVDDDPAMTRALEGFLHRHGFPVLTAGSARDALITAAASEPDIVLCDWHLGDDDGADVIRRLRPDGDRGPRCILMSGADLDERVPEVDVPWLFKGPDFIPELRALLHIDEL
jgi:CheY-like chemotaxis protein